MPGGNNKTAEEERVNRRILDIQTQAGQIQMSLIIRRLDPQRSKGLSFLHFGIKYLGPINDLQENPESMQTAQRAQ